MDFIRPYIYFIAVSFLFSLIVYKRPRAKDMYLLLFPPFLLATLVVEVYGAYLNSISENNNQFYNFFTVFEFCFYLWVISSLVKSVKVKRAIYITIASYSIIAVINIIFFQGLKVFHTTTYALGCLVVTIFCIYYFVELSRLPKSVNLFVSPAFWICSGLLLFYICGFPLFALINQWMKISRVIIMNFFDIIWALNMILYTSFTVAFLCSKTKSYTLSSS